MINQPRTLACAAGSWHGGRKTTAPAAPEYLCKLSLLLRIFLSPIIRLLRLFSFFSLPLSNFFSSDKGADRGSYHDSKMFTLW